MEEILIEKAILHILDASIGTPVLSERPLPLDESADFFSKHIDKLFGDSEVKECSFEDGENPIRDLMAEINGDGFISATHQMASRLYDVMSANVDIPPADFLFTVFRRKDSRYLGIVKFNYKEAYTHSLVSVEGSTATNVIKYKTLFANETQKVDECVFVDLSSHAIKIKEKKYELDGQKEYYLSNRFMKTQPARSYKEQYRPRRKIRRAGGKEVLYRGFPETGRGQDGNP